jgi:hypothetical protein
LILCEQHLAQIGDLGQDHLMLGAPERARRPDRHRIASWSAPVTLRRADDGDDDALRRLAALDSHPLPPGPLLVAERDRIVDAAVSLSTGDVVANPFRRTTEIAALLRCHAAGARVAPEDHASAAGDSPPLVSARLVTT